MISYFYDKLESREFISAIFLDLKKAFDTVDHSILIRKMNHYGFRGHASKFFQSYLSYRQQCVKIGSSCSELATVQCGIPQVSIIGPLMFLLFVNDLPHATNLLVKLFADDTGLFGSSASPSDLELGMNSEMDKILTWMTNNKLTINVEKSKCLLISHKNNRKNKIRLEISINGSLLENVNSFKYLGIHIDDQMKWATHINYVAGKLASATGMLYKLRKFLTMPVLRMVYFSLFQSYLQYGIISWGNASTTLLRRLEVLQNKAVRSICNAPFRSRLDPLYHRCGIIKLGHIHEFEVLKLMHQYFDDKLPMAFTEFFTKQSNIHSYSTRSASSGSFHVPRYSSSRTQKSIKYIGVKLWNALPNTIRSLAYCTFKRDLKNKYIGEYLSSYTSTGNR